MKGSRNFKVLISRHTSNSKTRSHRFLILKQGNPKGRQASTSTNEEDNSNSITRIPHTRPQTDLQEG